MFGTVGPMIPSTPHWPSPTAAEIWVLFPGKDKTQCQDRGYQAHSRARILYWKQKWKDQMQNWMLNAETTNFLLLHTPTVLSNQIFTWKQAIGRLFPRKSTNCKGHNLMIMMQIGVSPQKPTQIILEWSSKLKTATHRLEFQMRFLL